MASSDKSCKNNDVHQDYNRKMLVDAIAANIYYNIKENNDISKLLAEGMAQSGEDKGTMIQALMGRLLAAPPSTTKNNAHILNSLDTTLESTTPSGSRAISPEASEATLLLDDAKSDFIYQSSCKIQEKGYMGPSGPTPHDQLPLPVAELAIPLSVQEISNKNAPAHKQINYQTRTSTVQRASSFNNGQRSTVTAEVVEGKRRMSLSSEDKKVITLPPKPSASFRNNNFLNFKYV